MSSSERLHSFVRWAHPWLHATVEGGCLAYQLAYLLEVAEVHSPLLHLLGLRLARVSGAEMVMPGACCGP